MRRLWLSYDSCDEAGHHVRRMSAYSLVMRRSCVGGSGTILCCKPCSHARHLLTALLPQAQSLSQAVFIFSRQWR